MVTNSGTEPPLCPYFGRCGGCTSQDRSYADQLEAKKGVLSEAIGTDDIQVFASPPFHYRNRMDFAFHSSGLGLRERGAYDKFVDIEHCVISNPELNSLLTEVRAFFEGVFYFDVRRRFGAFCYAVIRTPAGDSSVSIVLNKKDKRLDRAVARIREYAEVTTARNLVVTYVPHNRNISISDEYEVIKGDDMLSGEYLGHRLLFPVQGFFQVNQDMAVRVHEHISGKLRGYSTQAAHLLDLYGGVGAFAIINAPSFSGVTILENYEPAIRAAELNIANSNTANVETRCRDARHLAQEQFPSPLFIVLDPPRSGINPKTLKHLSTLECEALFYVSCNPKHLANDLAELGRFQIKSTALFDMFPQTPHMEVVVELLPR
jgi:23S rRNA (uracil-5-)-methyltransferase RumA